MADRRRDETKLYGPIPGNFTCVWIHTQGRGHTHTRKPQTNLRTECEVTTFRNLYTVML